MTLKCVYLYMSHGAASSITDANWDPSKPCANKYVDSMRLDGSFIMLSELKRTGVIDDAKVFYESNRQPGFADWGRGITGHVCPQIDWVRQFIDDDTVIYVRGGFRGWFKLLTDYKNKNWLMGYNANTGRQRWKFWDIILWDLGSESVIDSHERLWYHYVKPVDESVFQPINQPVFYDLCIGASHIHDKKGQWRTIQAMLLYRDLFGKDLIAVLPGYGNKGVQTQWIIPNITKHNLNVTVTGMLSGKHLNNNVYNRSKLGVFLGTHGQGDRGPIEALATGLPIVIGDKRYHSPEVSKFSCAIPEDINNMRENAKLIHDCLSRLPDKMRVYNDYKATMGFKEVCYPNIKRVFEFIRENKKPSLDAKKKFLDFCKESE